jgi:hypothetical protein
VDGDGKVEIVATTRVGTLFIWDTPGIATEAALPWAGYGRDRRNTKNGMSGVSSLAGAADPLRASAGRLSRRDRLSALRPRWRRPHDAGRAVTCAVPDRKRSPAPEDNEVKTPYTAGTGVAAAAVLDPALAPARRFIAAGARHARTRDRATKCAATNTACKQKLNKAKFCLWLGDNLIHFDPVNAVRSWARGIAAF